MSNTPSAAFSDTKAHYDLLDGLRGVAALMVIWYHIFEGYAFASDTMITTFNHGYLAVDSGRICKRPDACLMCRWQERNGDLYS